MTTAEQIVNRFGIVLVIIPSDEVNGVAALLLVLVEPQVSAYGNLLTAVVPFILRADLFKRFTLTVEQSGEVSLACGILLFIGVFLIFC